MQNELDKVEKVETKSPFEIVMSNAEKAMLMRCAPELKLFELAWLRTYKANKWEPTKQKHQSQFRARKEAFRQGWNAQVYMRTGEFVLSTEEARKINDDMLEQERAKNEPTPSL